MISSEFSSDRGDSQAGQLDKLTVLTNALRYVQIIPLWNNSFDACITSLHVRERKGLKIYNSPLVETSKNVKVIQ